MSNEQFTWSADVKDILRHKSHLYDQGETVLLDETHGRAWAQLYQASYATQFAFSLEEATAEWQATMVGEYGAIWPAASPQFMVQGKLVGSLLTVLEAPWNDLPPGPFLIELFIAPEFRRKGIATWLLALAAEACLREQKATLALRVLNANTNAKHLYAKLGFKAWSR